LERNATGTARGLTKENAEREGYVSLMGIGPDATPADVVDAAVFAAFVATVAFVAFVAFAAFAASAVVVSD